MSMVIRLACVLIHCVKFIREDEVSTTRVSGWVKRSIAG